MLQDRLISAQPVDILGYCVMKDIKLIYPFIPKLTYVLQLFGQTRFKCVFFVGAVKTDIGRLQI